MLLTGVGAHQFHGSGSAPPIERRKYHIRMKPNGFGICIDHLCSDGLMRTLWAVGHEDLIAIARSGAGKESGGSFHIDPDGCVVVGVGDAEICVGTYVDRELIFEGFQMKVRTNPDNLEPGDRWTGPSVGRRYKLSSKDVGYESLFRRSYALSDVDKVSTLALARRLGKNHPNSSVDPRFRGGRIYVNEHRRVFAPLSENSDVTADVYLGELRGLWFPAKRCPM
jgi:hypothetical protein